MLWTSNSAVGKPWIVIISLFYSQIEGDHLVYSNQLIYTPKQNNYGIVRTSGAAIPVECHYKRFVIPLYVYNNL